jgi:uncharacterized membrane protein
MKRSWMVVGLCVGLVALLTACGTQPTDTATPEPAGGASDVTPSPTEAAQGSEAEPSASSGQDMVVSFAGDVLPVLQSRCVTCHGGEKTAEGLSLKTYADLMAGAEDGPVVAPGDAADSAIVELVASGKMPKRGGKLAPEQVQMLTDWVDQGALDN